MSTSELIEKSLQKTAKPAEGLTFLKAFEENYIDATGKSFIWNEDNIRILTSLFGNSEALSKYLTTRPKYAQDIAKNALNCEKATDFFYKSFSKLDKDPSKSIRLLKYNALSAITASYLLGDIDVIRFGELWSELADKCCELALQHAKESTNHKYGSPQALNSEDKKIDFKFVVMGLGKLGADELNFSSDIDIIFLYNSDKGQTTKNISLSEYISKLSNNFIKILSETNEDRFCFRVDTNLRPEGSKGSIAHSLDAAISYYEYWGEEWERMMLLRAKPIAGDIQLGNDFLDQIKPFIYRKSLDINTLNKIRLTKKKIELESSKHSKGQINLKLGPGGIREVEFIIQSLQLIHGGRKPEIITNQTFSAIDRIKKAEILPKKLCTQLKKSYFFLRHIENMVQIVQEKQTHLLPKEKKEITETAIRSGITDKDPANKLLMEYDKHTGLVKQTFQHMFQSDYEKQQMEEAILTNISTCMSDEEEIDSLPWFKREETKRIQYLDLEKGLSVSQVSEKLSLVAEVVVSEAYKLASENLRKIFGPPMMGEGPESAALAIVGVGKLGGREIDYASDLDLMFIFSGSGNTAGPKVITNQEYFTKLSQRIISLITLPTRYGRAYQIDTDLRPSGRAGILVSSIDSISSYHRLEAQLWERQSLIKARVIAGDPKFCEQVQKTISEIVFETQNPADLKEQIHNLRLRMEKEKAKESEGNYDIKLGLGGLIDIESIVQYLQLVHGKEHPELRKTNTLNTIFELRESKLLDKNRANTLEAGYNFYRRILSRVRFFSNHATDNLNIKSGKLDQIATSLGFADENQLIDEFLKTKEEVREIYNCYFK